MAGVKETMSDAPKPLTEKDLGRIDEALRGWFGRDDAQLLVEHPAKPGAFHPGVTKGDVRRLLADVRRLRALAMEAYPHVPDRIETRELRAKLTAEGDRG